MDLRPKLCFLMVLTVFLAAPGTDLVSETVSANLAATFDVVPKSAVPNETVTLLGTGFTPSTTGGGSAAAGAHQVTGLGGSVIIIGTTTLVSPNVSYPIDFDADGSWTASITIPITAETVAGGSISISVLDDQGFGQTTQITMRTPLITLDPASSRIKTVVTVTGQDFPAANPLTKANSQVPISYDGFPLTVVSANLLGGFIANITVPETADISSDNIVRAQVLGFDWGGVAIHSVPGPIITLSPASGVPGTVVTVSGEGFPTNVLISNVRAGNINVSNSLSPSTDNNGNSVSYFAMPVFVPGVQSVAVTAGGITSVIGFTVLEGAPVSHLLPTPKPSTLPADALASLIQREDLIRVWNFDNSTKNWEFFDPRPAFINANTIKIMVPGRIYWLRMNRVQTATLNGKAVKLISGWNLVPW
ncbi:MAG: hypothetical protein VX664_05050 [Chloroflexota bacterium]|nr:hypothetical protein [Chloroflexota bacterium]